MDGIKLRSSLDDPRQAASALRRFAHSPRLSRRRPPSTTSSSASSIVSHDHQDEQQSCVSRETSGDDCALNRFIVWAAVRRNTCLKMTSEERRECPLLRCRKRFPDHEMMLKHLTTCDQLAAGEYWCYECAKVERFIDAKAKKCLGHPSKRKKIMFMAKNFFNSLGHRSRHDSLPMFDLEIEDTVSITPSSNCDDDNYGFVIPPSPMQAELQSNEIHEIDSHELSLPTIIEDEHETEVTDLSAFAPVATNQQAAPDLYSLPISMPTFHPAELESGAMKETLLMDWHPSPQPATISPANLIHDDQARCLEKPSLQLHTSGLEQYRARARAAKSRSKYLAPSSSVRSNASTDSTNSTSSTASYNISPISAWSGGWVRNREFESALTSPADDLAYGNPFGPSDDVLGTFDCQFDSCVADSLSIPPSIDIPILDVTPPTHTSLDHTATSSDVFEIPPFSFDIPELPSLPTTCEPDQSPLGTYDQLSISDSTATFAIGNKESSASRNDGKASQKKNKKKSERQTPRVSDSSYGRDHHSRAATLIRNAYEALELHVAESMARMQHVKNSQLVNRLYQMSTNTVAAIGLDTLVRLLQGSAVNSPSDLLCFVHLAYSFSLVIHEHDAPARGTKLFSQAVSYAAWLTRDDRRSYLQIVNLLWKPNSMNDDEAIGLMRKASSASRSTQDKTSETAAPYHTAYEDSLIGVSQIFLDELEYSAVLETSRPQVQASDLCGQHMQDANLAISKGSSFEVAVGFMRSLLLNQYSDNSEFVKGMGELFSQIKSSRGSTPRRFELGLLRIGKMTLSSDKFADEFVPGVRKQIDSVFDQTRNKCTPRLIYHEHGVRLVRSLVVEIPNEDDTTRAENPPQQSELEIDDLINLMTPQIAGFNFGPISHLESPSLLGVGDSGNEVSDNSMMVTPDTSATAASTEPPTAATTPLSASATHQSSTAAAGGSKVESDSCCEICGYRPEGDPRWFPGSMAKHKKLQHPSSPPKIYRCPFPGCTSQYKSRPDNLRQHQIKKGHFVDGEDEDNARRPSKRKKMDA